MVDCMGYAAYNATDALKPFKFTRREPGFEEICIKVLYCGVCHSDIYVTKEKWMRGIHYPCVPGHEIVGEVVKMGPEAHKFKKGDYAAVGCFVDSCGLCKMCRASEEPLCPDAKLSYNSPIKQEGYTKGGYSTYIVLKENFAFTVPMSLHKSLAKVAPLLCAGITVYSPMMEHKMYVPGKKIGVVGLGGLGHMAVKFAKSFNSCVTVISTSESKKSDALQLLHADKFLCTKDKAAVEAAKASLDFIIYTAPNVSEFQTYTSLLAKEGSLVLVALPEADQQTIKMSASELVAKKLKVAGSVVGGNAQIQEMLDYCGEAQVLPEIEMIKINEINSAYQVLQTTSAVKYRYVIDIAGSTF